MAQLKIGFDAKRLFYNHTGLGNYSRTLVRNIQRYFPEHEYHLFVHKISNHDEVKYFLDESKFIIHTYDGVAPSIWRSRGITKDINAANLDIYHGLSHEIPFNSHLIKAKTVATFHDLIYEYYPKQFGMLDRYFYRKKYRYSAKQADHVIAISESTKKDLVQTYCIGSKKISVVYQSSNPKFATAPIKDDVSEEIYLLYVGSLIERKSFHLIVEAIEKMAPEERVKVKVVGKGGAYADQVKSMVETQELGDWFDFLDHINNEDLISLYDQALAMVYPSIYEGFGIPIIEALSRRTPVITTTASSLPEAAGPGAILIEPNDSKALREAIKSIQHDQLLRKKLANAGFNHVKESFGSKKVSHDLMALYYKLAE